jgi:outer membrane murein-binding lipoprotein Lpp
VSNLARIIAEQIVELAERIAQLERDRDAERERADAYRSVLVSIANAESGSWGVMVRRRLREIEGA